MPVSVPSVSHSVSERPVVRGGRLLPLAAALALIALAGCADKPKDEGGTIVWSEPGAATGGGSSAGTASPGAPATMTPAPNNPSPSGPPLDWRTGLQGDMITVEIRDRTDYYRVERVELIGPNALTVAAYEINRSTTRDSGSRYGGWGGGPNVGVGVGSWSGGRHSGSGVGLGLDFPLGGSSSYDAPPTGTVTAARLKIPDLALYRQTAASWVVRVTFTDRAKQQSSAVIPAPKPAG